MNKQPIRGVEPAAMDEEEIAEYLIAHPEFFERHAACSRAWAAARARRRGGVAGRAAGPGAAREARDARAEAAELVEIGRANDALVDGCTASRGG